MAVTNSEKIREFSKHLAEDFTDGCRQRQRFDGLYSKLKARLFQNNNKVPRELDEFVGNVNTNLQMLYSTDAVIGRDLLSLILSLQKQVDWLSEKVLESNPKLSKTELAGIAAKVAAEMPNIPKTFPPKGF